jgi:hypothetical protein
MKPRGSLLGDVESCGDVGDRTLFLSCSRMEASDTYMDDRFMCCIVGGGPVMLIGRGLGVCSDSCRWCCLLRVGLMPPLHTGDSDGKEEYESILMSWMSGAVGCTKTKKECYVEGICCVRLQ